MSKKDQPTESLFYECFLNISRVFYILYCIISMLMFHHTRLRFSITYLRKQNVLSKCAKIPCVQDTIMFVLIQLLNCVTNLHYVLIYYILDNSIWLYFPLTPIEMSNRPIVYHVVRLPMRFKQGELKVSQYMHFEGSTRFVFK